MGVESKEIKKSAADNAAIQGVLQQVIRQSMLKVMARASALENCQVEEVENRDDFLYGHWMALILVSGPAVRVILKLHFDTATSRGILVQKLRRRSEDIDERMAMDHMRELCNLMAGAVKSAFNAAKIITGISIPLVTSGFDEAVFSDRLDARKIHDVWKITWPAGELTCSSLVDVFSWGDLLKLKISSESEDSEGYGEFL